MSAIDTLMPLVSVSPARRELQELCSGLRAGQDGDKTLGKAVVIAGLLSCLVAPAALSDTVVGSASNATIPATLLSLALLSGLKKK